VGGFNMTTQFQ